MTALRSVDAAAVCRETPFVVTLRKYAISLLIWPHGKVPRSPIPNGGDTAVATIKYIGLESASLDMSFASVVGSNGSNPGSSVGEGGSDRDVGGGVAVMLAVSIESRRLRRCV